MIPGTTAGKTGTAKEESDAQIDTCYDFSSLHSLQVCPRKQTHFLEDASIRDMKPTAGKISEDPRELTFTIKGQL